MARAQSLQGRLLIASIGAALGWGYRFTQLHLGVAEGGSGRNGGWTVRASIYVGASAGDGIMGDSVLSPCPDGTFEEPTYDRLGVVQVRDRLGRVTRYTYDLAGRLKTVTDPKDQVTTCTYALDDAVVNTVWTNADVATPSV